MPSGYPLLVVITLHTRRSCVCAEHVVLPRYPVTSLCPPAHPISSQDLFKLFKLLFASLNYTPQTPPFEDHQGCCFTPL